MAGGSFINWDTFAQGSGGASQLGQHLLLLLKVDQAAGVGVGEDALFEFLRSVHQVVRHEIVVVDDRVDQAIGQILGPPTPGVSTSSREPFAQAVKDVTALFLKRKNRVVLGHDGDLFDDEPLELLVHAHHLQDDQEPAVVERCKGGAVPRVHDVLELKGVQPEPKARLLHEVRNVNPIDVDPTHRFVTPRAVHIGPLT